VRTDKLKLYLDDVRIPNDESWSVVKNYQEFINFVNLHGLESIVEISLDHDLGESAMVEYYTNVKNNFTLDYDNIKEKTGMDCCRFLVDLSMSKSIPLPQIFIHSANPIGSGNMMGYINNYFKNCRLPQTCCIKQISHTISGDHLLPPEARKAKWDKSNK